VTQDFRFSPWRHVICRVTQRPPAVLRHTLWSRSRD
jgi:hypothetical protein